MTKKVTEIRLMPTVDRRVIEGLTTPPSIERDSVIWRLAALSHVEQMPARLSANERDRQASERLAKVRRKQFRRTWWKKNAPVFIAVVVLVAAFFYAVFKICGR